MKNNLIKPWLVLAVCCGLAASSIGVCFNSTGVFYQIVSQDLGVLKGTFTLHMTISSIVSAFGYLFIVKLIHHYPYKRILFTGVLATVITTALMGMSHHVYEFYLLGAIRGLAIVTYSMVVITIIIGYWFEKSHGLATSIVLSFSGVAGAVCSPILSHCIEAFGWRHAYFIMAGMVALLCLPALLLPFQIDPANENMHPYGYDSNNVIIQSNNETIIFNPLKISFITFVIFAILMTAITGIPSHFPSYALTLGLTSSIGAMMLSASMIGNIISKLVIGFLSDRIGIMKASTIILIVNGIASLLLITFTNVNALIVGAALFGSIFSIGAVGIALLTKEFFGTKRYSKVYPMVSFMTSISSAASLTLVGYIYDFTNSYRYAFLMAITFVILGLILLIFVRKTSKVDYD